MIEISGFSHIKRPLISSVTCDVTIERRKSVSSIDLKPGGSTGDKCTTINTTLV